ncbi:MAG: hypothetical protein ACI9Y7_000324 [Dokdonia sp.]|jgi:hypothetical protein
MYWLIQQAHYNLGLSYPPIHKFKYNREDNSTLLDPDFNPEDTGAIYFGVNHLAATARNPLTNDFFAVHEIEYFDDENGGGSFSTIHKLTLNEDEVAIDYDENTVYFDIDFNVNSFDFDKNGLMYVNFGISPGLQTINLNTGKREDFNIVPEDTIIDGLTYDTDNDRFIISSFIFGNDTIDISSIDVETGIVTFITAIPFDDYNNSSRIEYVGNDTVLVSTESSEDGFFIFSINLNSEEVVTLLELDTSELSTLDIFFVEDGLNSAVLSTTEFTCDDLGENTITVTQEDQTTCEVTVTVIDPIQTDCQAFIEIEATEGETSTSLPDYTSNFSNICGGITITQTPEPGTIININEMVTVIITITDANGEETIFEFIVELRSLGIDDEILNNSIQLYPNPTTDIIIVHNNNINVQLSELIISDINGRILDTITIKNTTTKETTITLEKYPPGIYFARIVSSKASTVRRIIKK